MPNRQPTGAIVDRLRNNSFQDWRWVVPWALFNDEKWHSSQDIIEAVADAIERGVEKDYVPNDLDFLRVLRLYKSKDKPILHVPFVVRNAVEEKTYEFTGYHQDTKMFDARVHEKSQLGERNYKLSMSQAQVAEVLEDGD